MKKQDPTRRAIYPSDVQRFTGRSYRTACRMINIVRKEFEKMKNDVVTVYEFCSRFRLNEEEFIMHLTD